MSIIKHHSNHTNSTPNNLTSNNILLRPKNSNLNIDLDKINVHTNLAQSRTRKADVNTDLEDHIGVVVIDPIILEGGVVIVVIEVVIVMTAMNINMIVLPMIQ